MKSLPEIALIVLPASGELDLSGLSLPFVIIQLLIFWRTLCNVISVLLRCYDCLRVVRFGLCDNLVALIALRRIFILIITIYKGHDHDVD